MQRDQKIVFPFFRQLPGDYSPSQLIFRTHLTECALDQAVAHPKDGITSDNCVLTSDLTGVDRSNFKSKIGLDGEPYFEVHYNLVVSMQTAMMKFSLEIDGEEMGSVQAKYD